MKIPYLQINIHNNAENLHKEWISDGILTISKGKIIFFIKIMLIFQKTGI